jgi:hypothetical protein
MGERELDEGCFRQTTESSIGGRDMSGVYSKAYQEKDAGRVREDEKIGFFKGNKIATPARVTNFVSQGGQTPAATITEDKANEFVGKAVDLGSVTSTKRNKGTGVPPNVQIS